MEGNVPPEGPCEAARAPTVFQCDLQRRATPLFCSHPYRPRLELRSMQRRERQFWVIPDSSPAGDRAGKAALCGHMRQISTSCSRAGVNPAGLRPLVWGLRGRETGRAVHGQSGCLSRVCKEPCLDGEPWACRLLN